MNFFRHLFISILKITPIFFVSIFIPEKILAEEYQCFSSWEGNPTQIKLTRNKNVFNMINVSYEFVRGLKILFEDKNSLVLGIFSSYTNYDGFFVLYLDKNTMKYRSTTVIDPNIYRTTIPIKNGDCIKKSLFPKGKSYGGRSVGGIRPKY